MDWKYDQLRITVHVEEMGCDLSVNIYGGDRAHIGSVAIAEPRPSLLGDGSVSATVSTYNCIGHKDGEVASAVAHELARCLNRRTVVVCGIHYDSIQPEVLAEVRSLTDRMVLDIAGKLSCRAE